MRKEGQLASVSAAFGALTAPPVLLVKAACLPAYDVTHLLAGNKQDKLGSVAWQEPQGQALSGQAAAAGMSLLRALNVTSNSGAAGCPLRLTCILPYTWGRAFTESCAEE